ncbi:MAG TPA: Hpt domain-containing protein, partial [Gemmataceae bacterium]|nr:Hpt domain-containing protein [Gemmataceae bacterium]
MDKNTLIQRLMATFLEELNEHVRTLNQDLLALEKTPTSEERAQRLKSLFRTTHSLKGAARSVSVGLIETTCHCLEGFLARVRDGVLTLTPERFALLFAAADAIEEAGQRLREEQDLTASPLAELLPRLEALEASEDQPAAPHAAPEAPAPSTETLPSAPSSASETVGPSATVRIPAEKLDALLARTGELLVARRRVEAHADELTRLRTFVEQWKTEWRRVERAVRKLLVPEDGAAASGDTAVRSGTLPRRVALALGHTGENLRRLEKDLEQLAAALAG